MKDVNFKAEIFKSFGKKSAKLKKVMSALENTKRKLNLSDKNYTWLKETIVKMIKEDRALFYSYITQDDEEITDSPEPATEQIQRKLEKLVENYINQREQQWRKRTM